MSSSRYGNVRRLRSLVGAYAGQVRDFPEDIADQLIEAGRAEPPDSPSVVADDEDAAADPPPSEAEEAGGPKRTRRTR